jgi:hypothetical protein
MNQSIRGLLCSATGSAENRISELAQQHRMVKDVIAYLLPLNGDNCRSWHRDHVLIAL